MRLASALSSEPSALVSRDERLLLGDGRVGLLEALHDLELAVLEVALAARERRELALETLRLLRSCCSTARRSASRALRASTTATSDSMRDELGAQVVAGAEPRRELLRELLTAGQQLLHARRLRRVPAGVIGLADAGVELGDLDEAALVCGAGIHASNLPGPSTAERAPTSIQRSTLLRKARCMSVLRTKSVEQSIADTDEPEFRLKKSLSALDLTVFGIGVVIGAGIFTLTGRAAHEVAGPGDRHQLRRRGHRVRPRGAVLRGVRLHRAGLGIGLHVLVLVARRAVRLDHRMGPHPGDVPRRERRRAGLERVPRHAHGAARRADPRRRSGTAGPSTSWRSCSSCVLGGLMTFGIKESLRVNMVLVAREALHRPVRHRRRHPVHRSGQLVALRPAGGTDARRRRDSPSRCCSSSRASSRRPSASAASSRARRSSSSPTSASTSSRRRPRRPRTRSATCPSASSPRSRSAPSSTARSPSS